MKNILIIGYKSFLSKNFVERFNHKLKFFFYKKYFKKDDKNFSTHLEKIIKKKKINLILNFAANNDNSLKHGDFEKILESNFYLPLSLIKIASKYKIMLFLFLSKDMKKDHRFKNFYSLSKEMLRTFIANRNFSFKLRIINIDSLYGPYDLNKKRILPSLFNNIYNNKQLKINLHQYKNFTFVGDLIKVIYILIFKKKNFIYKDVKSQKINIKSVFQLIKKNKLSKIIKKDSKYRALFLTSEWYKKYYGK